MRPREYLADIKTIEKALKKVSNITKKSSISKEVGRKMDHQHGIAVSLVSHPGLEQERGR